MLTWKIAVLKQYDVALRTSNQRDRAESPRRPTRVRPPNVPKVTTATAGEEWPFSA